MEVLSTKVAYGKDEKFLTGTASMTKSVSARSCNSVVVVTRCFICLASSSVIRCLPTSFANSASIQCYGMSPFIAILEISLPINFILFSIDASDESTRVTGTWATFEATNAIPSP